MTLIQHELLLHNSYSYEHSTKLPCKGGLSRTPKEGENDCLMDNCLSKNPAQKMEMQVAAQEENYHLKSQFGCNPLLISHNRLSTIG